MTYLRSRSRNPPPSPSMAKLHIKLNRIISRQNQLKLSFTHLKSHIENGLIETQGVFEALSVPLMKLVGLKSSEMAEEGRSSTFFMNVDDERDTIRGNTSTSREEKKFDMFTFKEEEYTDRVILAGNELIHKQKLQLIQLVQLLKQVESCVKSTQKAMFQNLDKQKEDMHSVLQKAFRYVSTVQPSANNDHALNITLKVLKAIYAHISEMLSSVEGGVDNLNKSLAEKMCKPMIEYVKSFKDEITTGTCPRLLEAFEDMKGVVSDGRVELEQARKQVRVAEERKIETLSMLKDSEEKMKKMKQYLEFVVNENKESAARNKLLASQADQTKDDKLLWEQLKRKQTYQPPQSPFGPTELLSIGTSTRQLRSTMAQPSITHRPTTRSYGKLKTPSLDSLLSLGSSPSVTTRQALLRRR